MDVKRFITLGPDRTDNKSECQSVENDLTVAFQHNSDDCRERQNFQNFRISRKNGDDCDENFRTEI
jgi:hypothetical protein